jgi:hypothetical protein
MCENGKNMEIRCVNISISSAKNTPTSTANNVSWLFGINATLNIIFNAQKIFLS